MMEVGTVVIGAGVVGLSVARALAASGRDVLVLEAAAQAGTETSSRNSEVIHSGLYYPTGSMKARLCVSGREQLYAYCESRGVPHRRTGKYIVAATEAELPVLEGYRTQAIVNGVGDLPWLALSELRREEPALGVAGGIHCPATGIIDSHSLMLSFIGDIEAANGALAYRSRVLGGRRDTDGFVLEVDGLGEPLHCRELVNCAGLSAPAIARTLKDCAEHLAPTAYFARGHYFSLAGAPPFRRLIYPVAEPGGLGVHVTLDLEGQVRFGPDVEWVPKVRYEFDATRRGRFAAAIRRYFPGIVEERLQPAYVGVRPKISGPGEPADDFRIDGPKTHGVAGLVQLYGIESPGLTSSLALGAEAVRALEGA